MATKLEELLDRGVKEKVFPGCALGIWCEGQSRFYYRGRSGLTPGARAVSEETWFDLASLTKPLATALVAMALVEEGSLDLFSPIKTFFPAPYPLSEVPVAFLLCHSSGLPAHRPYFARLITYQPEKRRRLFLYWTLAEPLGYPPGFKEIYSDLGFFLLGEILSLAGEAPFDVLAQRIYLSLGLSEALTFCPRQRKIPLDHIAPTELCPWRGKLIWGEVHDENTWVLGGAAGQAGLFGRLEGVLSLTVRLYECYQGQAGPFKKETVEIFWNWRQQGGTWALGFDRPQKEGYSSAGSLLSREAWGHLGFTGTSFWIDPKRDLIIVFLSNRIHPRRNNEKIKAFRPVLHDLIVEEISSW
ncbi:serine hydrolase domain-containing protein [Thermosulfuriphilus sp.]